MAATLTRRWYPLPIAVGILCLASLSAVAVEDEIGEDAGLEELLTYAERHNPGLDAARGNWNAASERIPQASALPDPQFNYSYLIEEVETRVGSQKHKLSLMQHFPWFGKRGLMGKMAASEAEAEGQRYRMARRELFQELSSAYYELAYFSSVIEVTRENLHLLDDLENVVRTNYRAGKASYSDLIRSQVERGKLEERLLSVEDMRRPLATRLNALLGRPADALLPSLLVLPAVVPEVDEDELYARLPRANPELLAMDAMTEGRRRSVELARKEGFPDFSLGLEYMVMSEAQMDVPDSGKDPVALMFAMNLPIWRGKVRAGVREAADRQLAADQSRRNAELGLVARLDRTLYDYRDAERKVSLYRDSLIPQGRQSLEVTRQAFEAGKVDFMSLVDAQRVLLEFELNNERALADRAQSLAMIEMLAGATDERNEP